MIGCELSLLFQLGVLLDPIPFDLGENALVLFPFPALLIFLLDSGVEGGGEIVVDTSPLYLLLLSALEWLQGLIGSALMIGEIRIIPWLQSLLLLLFLDEVLALPPLLTHLLEQRLVSLDIGQFPETAGMLCLPQLLSLLDNFDVLLAYLQSLILHQLLDPPLLL